MESNRKVLSEMTLEELWKLFPIILKPHNPLYEQWYREEKQEIEKAIGREQIFRLNHIGSTSVVGLTAKPIVDILLEVADKCDKECVKQDLLLAGWLCMSEEQEPQFRISFNKGYTELGFAKKVYHLHVREAGDCDELYFRDYLKKHSDVAGRYAWLKQELGEKYEYDRDAYTDAKTKFVKQYTRMGRMESDSEYDVYEMQDRKAAAHLFKGWEETMIWSCLQGYMGKLYADSKTNPLSAKIVIGDFCFLAGVPNRALVKHMPYQFLGEAILMVPQNEEWSQMIEQIWVENAERIKRYAIKKEPDVFDLEKLERASQSLPEDYRLAMIDEKLYYETRKWEWSRDLTAQFSDYRQYQEHGIGVVALKDNTLVAGASSYTMYDKGIEIEIDTEKPHRRKGLALACGAKLILECLKRGKYPSWDAHDLRSVALAEKLGYHMDREYPAYCVTRNLE